MTIISSNVLSVLYILTYTFFLVNCEFSATDSSRR